MEEPGEWTSEALKWMRDLDDPAPGSRRIVVGPKTRKAIEQITGTDPATPPTAIEWGGGWVEIDAEQIRSALLIT